MQVIEALHPCSRELPSPGQDEVRASPVLPSWASFSPAHESLAEGALFALVFLNWASQKLIAAIYADYARSLKNLGFKQGAVLFSSKAGAAGRDLLNELESPKQELTAQ